MPIQFTTPRVRARLAPLVFTLCLPLTTVLIAQDGRPGVARPRLLAEAGAAASAWDTRLADMEQAGRLRLRGSVEDSMMPGRVHDRFDQYVGEARILGAQIVRQRSANGVETVFGELYPDAPAGDARPAVPAADLRTRYASALGQPLGGTQPELVWWPAETGAPTLAWLDYVAIPGDVLEVLFDAGNGAELRRRSALRFQGAVGVGTGFFGDRKKLATSPAAGGFVADDDLRPPSLVTFDLRGNVIRAENLINGVIPFAQADMAFDGDNTWTDAAVVDAHAYVGFTYDYYFQRFNRRGLDGRDRPLQAIVHPVARADVFVLLGAFPELFTNAFWCDVCGGRGLMVFGDGFPNNIVLTSSGAHYNFASAALDVVAHELTHGVVSGSSNLDGFGEPGALNEAFADMMAAGTEFYALASGRTTRSADYTVGEDWVVYTNGRPNGVRSMADPRQFGRADHYRDRSTGPEDAGGVHLNAGIPGNAFYLAIEGGTNRTSGLAVQGVGGANREQIEKVFYRGFTQFLTPNATFAQARQATLQAARDLYGDSSPAFRAVSQAWTAVGVN